jgi:hypothetical protein
LLSEPSPPGTLLAGLGSGLDVGVVLGVGVVVRCGGLSDPGVLIGGLVVDVGFALPELDVLELVGVDTPVLGVGRFPDGPDTGFML